VALHGLKAKGKSTVADALSFILNLPPPLLLRLCTLSVALRAKGIMVNTLLVLGELIKEMITNAIMIVVFYLLL